MAIREIGASITVDATQFKKEMAQVNSNLTVLQAEMKAVTAEFVENANSAEALSAKQSKLREIEAQQAQKIRDLTKAYTELGGEKAKDTVLSDQIRKQLATTRAAYAQTQNQLKENAAAQEQLAEAAKKAADEEKKAAEAAKAQEKTHKSVSQSVGDLTKKIKAYNDEQKKKQEDSFLSRLKALNSELKKTAQNVPVVGSALRTVDKASDVAGKAMESAAKAAAALTAAGTAAAGAIGGLAISGLKTLTQYAVDAAQAVDADGNVINTRFSTLAENLTGLSSATDAAKAALGGVLLPALESLTGEGSKLLEGFVADLEAAEGDTEQMGKVVAEYLKKGVALIRQQLPEFLSLGKDLLSGLLESADQELPEILSMGEEILSVLLDGIEQNADGLGDVAIELVMSLVGFLAEESPELLAAGISLLTSVITGISSNLPQLIPVAVRAVVQLLRALGTNAPLLIEAGLELILAIAQGLVENIPELIAQVPVMIQDIKDAFAEKADTIKDLGSQIVDKIKEGLVEAWHKVTDWFSERINGLRGSFSISPSDSGSYASGLNYVPYDNFPAILHRGERILTAAENAAGGGNGGSTRVVNLTVNTQQLTESQVDYLIRRVNQSLGEEL